MIPLLKLLPLADFLHKLYHPEIFQGHLDLKKYFEGWYYKLVSQDEQEAIAIIPGIALYNEQDQHAFIQVINGVSQKASYHKFALSEFSADKKLLSFRIADNHFTDQQAIFALPELSGTITFDQITPIKTSILSPGIMGWYSFTPRMQCYHGIVSMHHRLYGKTTGSLGSVDWGGGVGYIEKDWGTSFPKCWVWAHSNTFVNENKVSVMASVAHIPWMGRYFPGFIVALLIENQEYRFATYNGAKMKCAVEANEVSLEFKKGKYILQINAIKGPTATLHSPISGRMTGKVNESLQATLELTLLKSGDEVWSGTGTSAGLEVAGETNILETEHWRS